MSNHDLDWLAAQQPKQMEFDHDARERARLALVQHSSRTGEGGSRVGRIVRTRRFGFAAATGLVGVAAAALAAVLVLPTGGAGSPAAVAVHVSHGARGSKAAVVHHAAISPLARLADFVSTSAKPAGDATLVERTTSGAGNSVTVYDLYADSGQYFFSHTVRGLPAEVSGHHDLADGLFAREIAAAKAAATGDVPTAAQDMADAPNPGHVISSTETAADKRSIAAKEAISGQPQDGTLYDNWVWEDSQDALIAGSGDPQVRAGVLRILATLPGVTVTTGTSGGQSTLVLTAGSDEVGYGATEQLTINADTGVPVQFVGGSTAGPAATVDYTVSRVTLANLSAAGAPSA